MKKNSKEIQAPSGYLVKHSAAVHIDNTLSLLERKVFNILLKNAFNNLLKMSEHKLRIKDLAYQVGWDSNSKQNNELKKSLMSINSTQVTWNLLNKDKKNTWGVAALISGAEIYNGVITYRFDEKIRQLLAAPSIYARLNLDVHQKFQSKYAYILWEFFVEILGSNNVDYVDEYIISLKDFRRFLVIIDKYEHFKDLNKRILSPSIEEINKVSDIEVTFQTKRESNKISHIIFSIKKKTTQQQEFNYALERRRLILESKLETINIPSELVEKYFNKYPIERVEKAMLITETDMLINGKVKIPAAYFKSALEQDWQSPKDTFTPVANKTDTITDKLNYDIEKAIKDISWQKVRKLLVEKYGAAIFNNWIRDLNILGKGDGEVIISAKNRFIAEEIKKTYIDDLHKFWQSADDTIKDVIITVAKKK